MIFPFSKLMELRETGWTVFDSPSPEATLASTCALDGPVILTTHVRPRPDAKGALATDLEMELHTDHPRARWIVWHCIRQSSEGGVSVLKDARAAFFRLSIPDQAELEVTTMGSHKIFPGDKERYPVSRIYGDIYEWIYYTPWLRREGANKALDAFAAALAETPEVRIRLKPGQALAVDNTRMLHGRTAIGGDRDRHLVRHWIGDARDNFSPGRGC